MNYGNTRVHCLESQDSPEEIGEAVRARLLTVTFKRRMPAFPKRAKESCLAPFSAAWPGLGHYVWRHCRAQVRNDGNRVGIADALVREPLVAGDTIRPRSLLRPADSRLSFHSWPFNLANRCSMSEGIDRLQQGGSEIAQRGPEFSVHLAPRVSAIASASRFFNVGSALWRRDLLDVAWEEVPIAHAALAAELCSTLMACMERTRP